MELIRGLHNVSPRHRGCVLTIGNFDGVHLGHQAVLTQLAAKAAELQVPAAVMLFEPQPQEFFAPDRAPARLSRLREKIEALRCLAIDRVLVLRFNRALAELEARAFVEDLLARRLGVRYLVVGDDFRFGHRRQGDFALLQAAGERHGFEVANMHTVAYDRARVSSTRVREALAAGDMAEAERLLGRPYRMCGRVAHGDRLGRVLGFPTANLRVQRRRPPLQGVYAVRLYGVSPSALPAVANIGTRPTVDGVRPLLEVHVLDFAADIYGRMVQVEFVERLREERRFESLEALKEQISRDVAAARAIFAREREQQQV